MTSQFINAACQIVVDRLLNHEAQTREARKAALDHPGILTGYTRTDIAIPGVDGRSLTDVFAEAFPVETVEAGGVDVLLAQLAAIGKFAIQVAPDPRNPGRDRTYIALRSGGFTTELRARVREELQAMAAATK